MIANKYKVKLKQEGFPTEFPLCHRELVELLRNLGRVRTANEIDESIEMSSSSLGVGRLIRGVNVYTSYHLRDSGDFR